MCTKINNQINNSILNNSVFNNVNKKIPKFLGQPVFLTDIFIGRDTEIDDVYKIFFGEDNLLLLVNGEGGIGKTTLAARYYKTYSDDYSHLAWIFAEKSLSDALLTLALPLVVCFPDQSSVEERLNLLFDAMRELKKPCLLVIDNANNIQELGKYYKALRSCPNFHLLLTTRITEFEQALTYKIKPLPDEKAIVLFKKLYPEHIEDENDLLYIILEAVSKNTLVIEILAKTLHNFNQLKTKYSLSNLLSDLQKKGLFGIQSKEEITISYHATGLALRKENPENIISAMYDLSELSDNERKILSIFSVLPAENIAYSQLEALLPDSELLDAPLLTLCQKGWVEFNKNSNSFKINPVIQEISQNKNPYQLNDCQQLIINLVDKLYVETGTGHFGNVSYAESNIYSRFAESILHVNKQIDINLAILSEHVGNYHISVGNLNKALTFFEESYRLIKLLSEANPQNVEILYGLAIPCSKLGETYTSLGDLNNALSFFGETSRIFKELYETFPQNVKFEHGLAISYLNLGVTHISFGKLNKALSYFEDETMLFQKLCETNPQNQDFKNGLATSYSKLGLTYLSLGKKDKALTYFNDENDLFGDLYRNNPQNVDFKKGLANSYGLLGTTHSLLGRFNRAITYIEKENDLYEDLYKTYPQNIPIKNGLAKSYSNLGGIYISLKKMDKALIYCEKSSCFIKELYVTYPQNVDYKNGLAISYSKLGMLHTYLSNYENAFTYYEGSSLLTKELNETFPQNVDYKHGLAIAYAQLADISRNNRNDKEIVQGYFKKAEQILSELVIESPKNVAFSLLLEQLRKDYGIKPVL